MKKIISLLLTAVLVCGSLWLSPLTKAEKEWTITPYIEEIKTMEKDLRQTTDIKRRDMRKLRTEGRKVIRQAHKIYRKSTSKSNQSSLVLLIGTNVIETITFRLVEIRDDMAWDAVRLKISQSEYRQLARAVRKLDRTARRQYRASKQQAKTTTKTITPTRSVPVPVPAAVGPQRDYNPSVPTKRPTKTPYQFHVSDEPQNLVVSAGQKDVVMDNKSFEAQLEPVVIESITYTVQNPQNLTNCRVFFDSQLVSSAITIGTTLTFDINTTIPYQLTTDIRVLCDINDAFTVSNQTNSMLTYTSSKGYGANSGNNLGPIAFEGTVNSYNRHVKVGDLDFAFDSSQVLGFFTANSQHVGTIRMTNTSTREIRVYGLNIRCVGSYYSNPANSGTKDNLYTLLENNSRVIRHTGDGPGTDCTTGNTLVFDSGSEIRIAPGSTVELNISYDTGAGTGDTTLGTIRNLVGSHQMGTSGGQGALNACPVRFFVSVPAGAGNEDRTTPVTCNIDLGNFASQDS